MLFMKNVNRKIKIVISYILTILIILMIAVFLYFLYFINKDVSIKFIGTIAIILLVSIWLLFEQERRKKNKKTYVKSTIKRFILITSEGERDMEWHCEGVNSFLIGKKAGDQEVDIDLSDTKYSEYVSNEHAVLNYSGGYWYIEDLNSANGVGVKKKGEEYALRLKPMVSYKLDEWDIIYISKAKILVR